MSYELGYFDELINRELQSPIFRKALTNKTNYEEIIETIRVQTHAVRNRLKITIFESSNGEVADHIYKHQSAIVSLANSLATQMSREDMVSIYKVTQQACFSNLCKIIYCKLEELQYFIGHTFPKYFDQDVQVAEVYRAMAAREVEEKLPPLKAALLKNEVDPELLTIAFAPFKQLITPMADQVFTYRKIAYLKELLRIIEITVQPGYTTRFEPTIDLVRLLYYMDFNSYSFFDYCKERIQKDLEEQPSRADQEERLGWYKKINSQYYQRPGYSLYPFEKMRLKQMLKCFLKDEAGYLYVRKPKAPAQDAANEERTEKLPMNLSVAMFAYLLRLLVETGIIGIVKIVPMIAFFTGHFTSLHNEDISAKSMRTKYYSTEPAVAEAVRNMLYGLISYSKKQNP